MNVYFLGGGNMAAAVAGGLVKQGGYRIHIANRGAEKRERLGKELGVETSATLPELHSGDVLILAVKPQDMEAACKNIRTNGALVLSVAAGLSVGTLSRYLGEAAALSGLCLIHLEKSGWAYPVCMPKRKYRKQTAGLPIES